MIRDIGCSDKNFKKGTISFKKYVKVQIEKGDVTSFRITNSETGEEYPEQVDAKLIIKNSYEPYEGADYLVSSFIIKPEVIYLTQKEISDAWGVRQCRMSELARIGLLVADSINGKTLQYSQESVKIAFDNPLVKTWIRNTSLVDKGS